MRTTIRSVSSHRSHPALFSVILALGGCHAHAQATGSFVRAQAAPDPPPAAPAATAPPAASAAPEFLPIPDQRRPMPPARSAAAQANKRAPAPAAQVVAEANRKATEAPDPASYFNAVAQYNYEPGALYQVFGAPNRITDVRLDPGEKMLGQPAAGDGVRWIFAFGKSVDGKTGLEQTHVYLKPTRANLETNVVVNTDRRSYLLDLRSSDDAWMAAVVWRYPEEELARLQAQATESDVRERAAAPIVSLDSLNFSYWIRVLRGNPSWTPLQVFDDGRKTFVRFPPSMLTREAPALFVLQGKDIQLVNYRVKGDTYVIDRLIDTAELRVGQEDQEIVRVGRGSGEPEAPLTRPIHGR